MSDALVPSYGNRYLTRPDDDPAEFSGKIDRHHRQVYRDPAEAQAHIYQALGDYSVFEVFGRQVLVAVYCKPQLTPGGIITSKTDAKSDWWEGKIVLVLKMGPEAFQGAGKYHDLTFGNGVPAPKVGDWLVTNANAGMQMNLCFAGASRPQGRNIAGNLINLFPEAGWPCRVMADDHFIGRIPAPHTVV